MGKKYSGGFFQLLKDLLGKNVSAEGKVNIGNGNEAPDTNKGVSNTKADIQIPTGTVGGKRKSRKHRKSHKKRQSKSRRRTY